MQKYNKAVVAILGGVVTLFGLAVEAEVIQAAATILTPILVYAIPNIDKETA
jgi:hypothetical protein